MSANDRSVHPYLRRSVDSPIHRNPAGSDFQRLMWTAIYHDHLYDKADVAAHLGVAIDTLHAYCNCDLRMHPDLMHAFVEYVAAHNPKDRRFIHYFLPEGWVAIPLHDGSDTIKTALAMIDVLFDLTRKATAIKGGKT